MRSVKASVIVCVTFFLGIVFILWQLPLIPPLLLDFVWENFNLVILWVGLPLILGAGALIFVWNLVFHYWFK